MAFQPTTQQQAESYNLGYQMGVTGKTTYIGYIEDAQAREAFQLGLKEGSAEQSRYGGGYTPLLFGSKSNELGLTGTIKEKIAQLNLMPRTTTATAGGISQTLYPGGTYNPATGAYTSPTGVAQSRTLQNVPIGTSLVGGGGIKISQTTPTQIISEDSLVIREATTLNLPQRYEQFSRDKNPFIATLKFPVYETFRQLGKLEEKQMLSQIRSGTGPGQKFFTPESAKGLTTYGEVGMMFNPITAPVYFVGSGIGTFTPSGQREVTNIARGYEESWKIPTSVGKTGLNILAVGGIALGASMALAGESKKALEIASTIKPVKNEFKFVGDGSGFDLSIGRGSREGVTLYENVIAPYKQLGPTTISYQGGVGNRFIEYTSQITGRKRIVGQEFDILKSQAKITEDVFTKTIKQPITSPPGTTISKVIPSTKLEDIGGFESRFFVRPTSTITGKTNLFGALEIKRVPIPIQTPGYYTEQIGLRSEIYKFERNPLVFKGISQESSAGVGKLSESGNILTYGKGAKEKVIYKLQETQNLGMEYLGSINKKIVYQRKIITTPTEFGKVKIIDLEQLNKGTNFIQGSGRKSSEDFFKSVYGNEAQLQTQLQTLKQPTKLIVKTPKVFSAVNLPQIQKPSELLGYGYPAMVGGMGLKQLTIPIMDIKSSEKYEVGLAQPQKMIQPQEIVLREFQSTVQPQMQKQFQPQAQPQLQIQKQQEVLKLKNPSAVIPKSKIPSVKPIPRVPPPKIQEFVSKKMALLKAFKGKQAYSLLLRREGKFQEVGKGLTLGEGLKRGSELAKTSLAATFRLVPKGTTMKEDIGFKVSEEFEAPKSTSRLSAPLTFIQKRGKRLSARSEVIEIMGKKRKSKRGLFR